MNFQQIKERTRPIVNNVAPISEVSLELICDLIEIEVYEKGFRSTASFAFDLAPLKLRESAADPPTQSYAQAFIQTSSPNQQKGVLVIFVI